MLVDSFLLSCRAMGRGIETALMNHVKQRLLDEPGHVELRGRFVPTARNQPAETFYEDQGFRCWSEGRAARKYILARRRSERNAARSIDRAERGVGL